MRCLHCGRRLSLLRKLADNGFCSEEHRLAFQQQQSDIALARLMEAQRRIDRPAAATSAAQKPAPPKHKELHRSDSSQERMVPMAGFRPSPPAERVEARCLPSLSTEPQFETILRYLPQDDMRLRRPGFSLPNSVYWMEPAAPPPPSLVAAAPALHSEARLPKFRLQLSENPLPLGPGLALPSGSCVKPGLVLTALDSAPLRALQAEPAVPRAGLRTLAPVIDEQVEHDPAMAEAVGLGLQGPLTTLQGRRIRYSRTRFIKLGPLFESEVPGRRFRVSELQPDMVMDRVPVGVAPVPCAPTVRAVETLLAACQTHQTLPERATQCGEGQLPCPQSLLAVAGPALSNSKFVPVAIRQYVKFAGASEFWPKLDQSALLATLSRAEGLCPLAINTAGPVAAKIHGSVEPVLSVPAMQAPKQEARITAGLGLNSSLEGLAVPGPCRAFSTVASLPAQLMPAPGVARALPLSGLNPVDDSVPAVNAPFVDRLFPLHPGRPAGSAPAAVHVCAAEPSMAAASRQFFPQSKLKTDRPDGSGPQPQYLRQTLGERFRNWWPPSLPGMGFLHAAPADLKWIGIGLPIVLLLIVYSTLPKASSKPTASPTAQVAVETPSGVPAQPASRWEVFQKSISDRAAINLTDDFRGGLGSWQGDGRWAETWKYNQAQFVEPGALALYSPTLPMADYSFEFLGQICRKSLNWVFRAKDLKNYYAMRLVLTSAGPLPQAAILRYAVIDGKESAVKTLPLPMSIKGDTLYRVRMDVKGDTFTTYVQGQVVDSFTDSRLPRGGIGFFSPKGDQTYLRWVEVSYQYDFLGRFCALLAPYSVQAEGRSAD